MKYTSKIIWTLVLLTACGKREKKEALYPESAQGQTAEQFGKDLFENKGNCAACHQPDQKIIGPSITQIATAYKDKGGDIVSFLKGNEEPLVDPAQFSVMQANFAITKAMSEDELEAIEAYIYTFKIP